MDNLQLFLSSTHWFNQSLNQPPVAIFRTHSAVTPSPPQPQSPGHFHQFHHSQSLQLDAVSTLITTTGVEALGAGGFHNELSIPSTVHCCLSQCVHKISDKNVGVLCKFCKVFCLATLNVYMEKKNTFFPFRASLQQRLSLKYISPPQPKVIIVTVAQQSLHTVNYMTGAQLLKKNKIRFVFFPSDSIISFFSLLPTAHSDVLPTPAYQWLRLGSIRGLIISQLFKSCGQCQHSTLALPLLASLSVSSGANLALIASAR